MPRGKRDTRAIRVIFGLSQMGLPDAAVAKYVGRSRERIRQRLEHMRRRFARKLDWADDGAPFRKPQDASP